MTVPAKSTAAWTVKATALNAGFLAAITATVASRVGVLVLTAVTGLTAIILKNPGAAIGIICLGFAGLIVTACIDLFKA